eukprot:jgi/Psemu1/3521/gm1.3521_g
MVRSSTTDRSDSERDRYSVIRPVAVSRSRDLDDDEETHNYSSHHHRSSIASSEHRRSSVASESSYSGTYGTSFVSEGSEISEDIDDNDDFSADDDYLSLESQHMVVDRWVDSACGCLDRPVSVYQNICTRRETSLLRQSKGNTRTKFNTRTAALPTPSLTNSAIKRRSLRLQVRSILKNSADSNNAEPMKEETKKSEIQLMQIQPKEDCEGKEVADTSNEVHGVTFSTPMNLSQDETVFDKPNANQETPPETSEQEKDTDQQKSEGAILEEPELLDVASMVERAIEKSAKESEEREVKTKSSIHSRDRSVKLDPPTESNVVATREGQDADYYPASPNHQKLEASISQNDAEKVSTVEDQDLPSPPISENVANEDEMRSSDNVSSDPEKERTHLSVDEMVPKSQSEDKPLTYSNQIEQKAAIDRSLSNSMEIIEVLSMDDQDSWIPGARNDAKQLTSRSGDDLSRSINHSHVPIPTVDKPLTYSQEIEREDKPLTYSHEIEQKAADDRSLSNNMEIIEVLSMDDQDSWIPGARNDVEQFTSRSGDDLSRSINHSHVPIPTVDKLRVEEEANTKKEVNSNVVGTIQSKELFSVESAADLWNEEKMKLEKSTDDIFDDPKEREAFLDRRQGRLRDTPKTSRNAMHSLPGQKRIQHELKENASKEDPEESRGQNGLPRPKIIGRNPPSPEFRTEMMQSGSGSWSRDQSLARKPSPYQQEEIESLTSSALQSRMKDLVAIRSIEEAQLMRTLSTRRASGNHRADSGSSIHAPIDVHSYTGELASRGPYDELQSRGLHRHTSNRRGRSSTPSRLRSRSRDPTGKTHLTNSDGLRKNHRFHDSRDDQESLPIIIPVENRPIHDSTLSATEKLRKLEHKIERQLRQVRRETNAKQELDPQTAHLKEIRRIERKLASKLKAFGSDEPGEQTVSSRDIRKLEKQLAQKMSTSIENENRGSKLKRIKRKGTSSTRHMVSSSGKLREERHQSSSTSSHEPELVGSPELATSPHSSKSYSHKSQDHRSERTKYETLQNLRSRYGRRGYSRVPETD